MEWVHHGAPGKPTSGGCRPHNPLIVFQQHTWQGRTTEEPKATSRSEGSPLNSWSRTEQSVYIRKGETKQWLVTYRRPGALPSCWLRCQHCSQRDTNRFQNRPLSDPAPLEGRRVHCLGEGFYASSHLHEQSSPDFS